MTPDPATEEIKRAVLAYFGLAGFAVGRRSRRQRLAAFIHAELVQDLLGESKSRSRDMARVDRHARSKTLMDGDRTEALNHLEPVVRSIATSIPFLRERREQWLDKHGRDRQQRLGDIG